MSNNDKKKLDEVTEIHPKDILGPVDDTRESITAFAAVHGMSMESATSLFILDELRRIHWGIDELLAKTMTKE